MARPGLNFLFVYSETALSPLNTALMMPPMGQLELAGFLLKQGYRCRILDTRHPGFSLDFFCDYLSEAKPDWIGFTLFTDTIFQVKRLIEAARKSSPTSRIALGGPHATLAAADSLNFTGADAVAHGEGETISLDLLRRKKLCDAGGISFRRGKKIVQTPPSPLVSIDEIPSPDLSLIEGWEEMNYQATVLTGRGCPYRCSFCAAASLSDRVRFRSMKRVVDDIKAVRRQLGGNFVAILDDTFTINPARTREFCRRIGKIGGGSDFTWFAEGRVDTLAGDPALVREMREAGLIMLQLGVESGDEEVLSAYRKNIKVSDAVKLFESCAREKVFVHAGFIVGGAFESEKTLSKSESLALKLIEKGGGLAQVAASYLTPLPGTDVFENPGCYGISLLDPMLLTSSMFNNCVVETEEMKRTDIIRAMNRFSISSCRAMEEAVKKAGPKFRDFCEKSQKRGTFNHASLLLSMGIDNQSLHRLAIDRVLSLARERLQFKAEGGVKRISLIPVRVSLMTVNKRNLYRSEFLKKSTTPAESQVIHFCAGKLTGREIAREAKMTMEQTDAALASLEKKELIIYRTF